mgnify:FL=1
MMPKAILVDIDGTAAIMNGRKPFDYNKVGEDAINFPVWETISALQRSKYTIVFCSGRENVEFPGKSGDKYFRRAYMPDNDAVEYPTCFDLTLAWLSKYCQLYDMDVNPPLFMRKQHDNRADWIVKKELFVDEISNIYDVKFVLDDRQQVVDMWRSLGLTCFQVAEGNF